MCGNNQFNSGPMILEECWEECESQDAAKMTLIQMITGNQYLKTTRLFSTAQRKQGSFPQINVE